MSAANIGLDTETEQKTVVEKNHDTSPMEKLPPELKERLASFLSTRDLLNLAETSKSVSSDLHLSVASSPLTDRASQTKKYRTNRGPECFAVIIPKQDRTMAHSMTFTCGVFNHRRDLSKSKVLIVEQTLPTSQQRFDFLRDIPKNRGQKIHQSLTRRNRQKLVFSFPVKANKFYQIYIEASGSEEHDFVRLRDISLHRVGFSESSTEYKAYQFDRFAKLTELTARRRRLMMEK